METSVRLWAVAVCLAIGFGLELQGGDEAAPFPKFTVEAARDYLKSVSDAVRVEDGDAAELYLVRARLQNQLGRQDEAERLARAGLARDGRRADIELFLADLFVRQDRLDEAADLLKRVVERQPEIEGGFRRLGMVLDRLGRAEEARAAFRKAVEMAPGDATAWLLLGRLTLDADEPREAIEHLEKACAAAPESANAYYVLSQAQIRAGEGEAAAKTLETFRELKRRETEQIEAKNLARDNAREMRALAAGFHSELGLVYLNGRRPDLAEAHWRQAVQIEPEEPLGYRVLTDFYQRKGRIEEAKRACGELVRLRPENADYRANLGVLLLQLEDFPGGIAQLERALKLDGNHPHAQENLARFYLRSGQRLGEALELTRRLVKSEPSAAHYDLLAWACFANGRIAEARSASAESVARAPDNPVYQQRHERLQQLP